MNVFQANRMFNKLKLSISSQLLGVSGLGSRKRRFLCLNPDAFVFFLKKQRTFIINPDTFLLFRKRGNFCLPTRTPPPRLFLHQFKKKNCQSEEYQNINHFLIVCSQIENKTYHDITLLLYESFNQFGIVFIILYILP